MLPRKYDYRRKLPHLQKDYRPVFVTFATHTRWELPETARQLALDSSLKQDGNTIDLHVVVVMPDRAHLIFSPRSDRDGPFSLMEIMHAIKGASAHAINQALQRRGRVWQEESFDHVLRSNESLAKKVDYLCQNPVRAGLARAPEEYPWLWRGVVPVL
ncbi:MAG TPA: transposase [Terriglobales bacterium]|nr:transposase [Terriglobales bacterium]